MVEVPEWAMALFLELAELREALERCQCRETGAGSKRWEYFDFITHVREKLRPDPETGDYPEVRVDGRRIGVTFEGFLYDKESGETLPRKDAFTVYRLLYRDRARYFPEFTAGEPGNVPFMETN